MCSVKPAKGALLRDIAEKAFIYQRFEFPSFEKRLVCVVLGWVYHDCLLVTDIVEEKEELKLLFVGFASMPNKTPDSYLV